MVLRGMVRRYGLRLQQRWHPLEKARTEGGTWHEPHRAPVREHEIRAEIADASGTPLKGFTFADCTPLATDSTQAMIAWKGDGDLTALHNRPVWFRFNLTSGSLYAFWIADKTGASHGYLAGGSPGHSGLVDDDISERPEREQSDFTVPDS